jgi:hypothetical protein
MLDRRLRFLNALPLLALSLLASCTKSEGQTSAAPSASTTAVASATPDASLTASDPPADTTATATATGGADAAAAAASASAGTTKTTASATAGTVTPAASAAPFECGKKPLPDCPLQGWMKANTNPPVAAQDFPALAAALDKAVTFAPAGYTNWASIAKDGAKAARAQDMTAAKAACRTCHDQYKEKYKSEMRTRKI